MEKIYPDHPVDKVNVVVGVISDEKPYIVGVDTGSKPDRAVVTKGRAEGYSEDLSVIGMEKLDGYEPDKLDAEAFRLRYAGIYQKDKGKRLSKSSMRGIWRRFMTHERHAFFEAHKNLTLYDVARVGIDKFVYTMGWRSKLDTARWRNNKVRLGICCHCQDQFIPMMMQHNHGLCRNCKPLYSSKAMRSFVLNQLATSERYNHAHRDMLMDFYIMFYHDAQLRQLFLKDSEYAQGLEATNIELPEWLAQEAGWEKNLPVDVEGGVVEDGEG